MEALECPLDGVPMQIKNSSESDGAVSLLCSARCTFHQLEVTWSRDGHALPQSGPALRLSALTAKDSGNYTCALENDPRTESLPYRLHVEAADGGLLSEEVCSKTRASHDFSEVRKLTT